MRIGIIAPPWVPVPPPGYGGIEVVIDNLARGLQAAGHEVLLHATAGSTCTVPKSAAWPGAAGRTGAAGAAAELRHVMIEALAQGTPVVATPCGSVPELIDDGVTGFVRSSGVDLALALRAVPTLDRSRCRRAAAKRFSTRRMVADHLAVYERIVAERHPRRAA